MILGQDIKTNKFYLYLLIDQKQNTIIKNQKFIKFYDLKYDDQFQSQVIAFAFALNKYHISTKYCSQCGQKLQYKNNMHTFLKCNQCNKDFYPIISPAIIVLISCKNKILLCHRRNNLYTNLSGFVELAESAKEAVYREIEEEVGFTKDKILNLRQMDLTQFWPSKCQSLMIAFQCEVSKEYQIRKSNEVDDAKWVDKNQFQEAGKRTDNNQLYDNKQYQQSDIWVIPKKVTIARVMMEKWFSNIQ